MKRILLSCICLMLCCGTLLACTGIPASAPAAPAPAAPSVPAPAAAPTPAPKPAYRYIGAQELYAQLTSGETPLLLDLQPTVYYEESGHLQGAVSTAAYPADSDGLLALLDAQMDAVQAASSVVLIDMGGKAGAHNAFDHYAAAGLDPEKLAILEGGMVGWPYRELVEISVAPYEYLYMSAKETRSALRHEEPLLLLDLRDHESYMAAQLKQSVNSAVFMPGADTNVMNTALTASMNLLLSSEGKTILLITADGTEDAQYAYDYYARHGIDPAQMYILEGGIMNWPEDYARYLLLAEADDSGLHAAEESDALQYEAPLAVPPAEPAGEPAEAVLEPIAPVPPVIMG